MSKNIINLDANATYGLLDEVKNGLCSEESLSFYNPSSVHSGGQRARALIEDTRELVLSLFGVSASEAVVVFTSGASESNNSAILAPFINDSLNRIEDRSLRAADIVSTVVEHPSVLEPVRRLKSLGLKTALVELDEGNLSSDAFLSNVGPETRLISVMMANNETGAVFPVEQIALAVKERFPDVFIHSDAVQLAGKAPIDFKNSFVDAVSFSGHKIGSLSGVGGLVIKRSALLIHPNGFRPLILGGAQEQKWRAGTENVVGIFSLNLALKKILPEIQSRAAAMSERKKILKEKLLGGLDGIFINYDSEETCLPNTLNIRIEGVNADDLVVALDLRGVLISSGSACSSGKPEPSHVLQAIGLDEDQARQSVRISLRAEESLENVNAASDVIINTVKAMRGASGYQPVRERTTGEAVNGR